MNMIELHPPHQAEYYEDVFREHIRWGHGLEKRGEVLGKDRRVISVSISTSVINIFGKKVVQGLFRDLTEEQTLLEYKERLEDNKLIGKAKAILMGRYHISEKESLERLQKESRNQRKRMKEIAQAVITSQLILG